MPPREGPILFSGAMVRGILDKSKSHTRRVIKPWHKCCPYGVPGDRLWVRETWCAHWAAYPDLITKAEMVVTEAEVKQRDGSIAKASADDPVFVYFRSTFGDTLPWPHLRWRSSRFMPRWASRITLTLTAVREERLRGISIEDCIAEEIDRDAEQHKKPDLWESIKNPRVWVLKWDPDAIEIKTYWIERWDSEWRPGDPVDPRFLRAE